ncbi:MAG: pilus assembly protein PilM [Candidatus Omnitrophica bacterium]|nr:pilus assembly protein PilM [Candidatus Omnitrophota bacterium]
MEKQKKPFTAHKDIVKDTFGKSGPAERKVSTLFTYFKHSQKVISPKQKSSTVPLKPLPAAIDIGTYSIKLLKLSESPNKKLEVTTLDYEPYTDCALSLKKIVERNKITGPCTTVLGVKEVQFYNMTFPQMPGSELAAAVRYKVAQLKPFNLNIDKIIHNFAKWETVDALRLSQTKVLVACAPESAISKRIALLKDLNLEPVAVKSAPFSIINLSGLYKPSSLKDGVALWLDIGGDESFLAVEKGGCLCFSRNLTSTSAQMTQAIAQHRGVSTDEADTLKKQYGLSFWSPDKKISPFFESGSEAEKKRDMPEAVYYALISLLENLVVDIEHTFKYFSYQVAQSQITKFDRVFISGGGANLKNLDQFLSVKLGVPVQRVNAFGVFNVSDAVQSQKRNLLAVPANFAICSGLALGHKPGKSRQVDFLPPGEKKTLQAVSEMLKERPVKIAVSFLAAALILLGVQVGRAGYYKARMNFMTEGLKESKVSLKYSQNTQLKLAKEEGELLSRKELLKARLGLLENSYRVPAGFAEMLSAIAAILPEEIWINKLLYKEGKFSIIGSTSDIKLISDLIEKIKTCEEFSRADFSYTQREPSVDVYTFEIIAEANG